MSRKKISTTIYVTPEQSDRLKVLHERTKVPVAVYIREGIDLVLRQYAHLLPGQLPLVQPPAPSALPSAPGASAEEAPKPRRRSDASQRELPSASLEPPAPRELTEPEPDDRDDEPSSRSAEPRDSKTALDKVAAGAKK